MTAPDNLLAFTEERTARMAGVPAARLRYWRERHGMIQPEIERAISPHRTVRLYGFRDAVDAYIIGHLRRQASVPLQQIRRVLRDIAASEHPLQAVELAYDDHELFWRLPGEENWQGGRIPRQFVFREVLDLQEIEQHVRDYPARRQEDIGRIITRRGVQSGSACFAGTRVTVAAVHSWLSSGADTERILEAYPLLEREDIESAKELALTA